MNTTEYRFDRYRLIPAARELWQDGRLLRAPRMVFDCLAYLAEHRDRAVGRDELISALWGRIDVPDAQVSHLVLRARRIVGDTGETHRIIRTVPGFGYRWAIDTETHATAPASASDAAPPEPSVAAETDAPGADDAHEPASSAPAPAPPPAAAAPRKNRRWIAVAALALSLAAIAAFLFFPRGTPVPPQTGDAAATAVVALPIAVDAPGDAAWVRLGAMDLIANRLRSAGLPVPPSDSVLTAIHAAGNTADGGDRAALRRILHAGMLVGGAAVKSADGWKVSLHADAPDGLSYRSEATRENVTDAASAATDMLLAALGRTGPVQVAEDIDLRERLQRAQAATLSNHLEVARSILLASPAPADPEIRLALAQIDLRAGRYDAAAATVDALLDDPVVAGRPLLHARALLARGSLNIATEVCDGAPFDAAVAALREQPRSPEYGIALARRGRARALCEQRYDLAAEDMGAAHALLEAAGDRLGVMHVNNYFGNMEMSRQHPAQALPYFQEAVAISESFGAIDWLRANLSALLDTHAALLQWPEVEAASDRLFTLRERIADPGLALLLGADRAHMLAALGRYREAERILDAAQAAYPNGRDASPAWRYVDAVRGELAWRQSRFADAAQTAAQALERWPESPRDDWRNATVLLRQRAAIASGQTRPDDGPDVAALAADAQRREALPPTLLVAAAEWAAHRGLDANAALLFRSASAQAGTRAIPAEIAFVAQSRARWLLASGRAEEAAAEAGRVALWAERDFDCALLQAEVFHAIGQGNAWMKALRQTQALAGERSIPAQLLKPPGSVARE